MSELNENYKNIISEIEQKISNPEEKAFVKQKVQELATMFIDVLERISNVTEARINQIEQKQVKIENKINEVQSTVNGIENDIYEEEENYDFEIVCPYCNNEFITEVTSLEDNKNEVQCPECHNIIELDWNEEEDSGCAGHCGGCAGCGDSQDNEENEEDDEDM